jgi:hypothetical protein
MERYAINMEINRGACQSLFQIARAQKQSVDTKDADQYSLVIGKIILMPRLPFMVMIGWFINHGVFLKKGV